MSPLGVVVPAYRPDVDRLRSYVAALDERLAPARIVIELDAPHPGVVDALADCPASVAVAPNRRGKGRAVAAGFDRLLGNEPGDCSPGRNGDDTSGPIDPSPVDAVAFFDADASTPPKSAAAVVSPVLAGDEAVAVGSRRHPEADVGRHQTLGRRRLGDTFAWVARRLVTPSLFDYQCGAKALSADAWRDVRGHLREPGFGWDLELLVTAAALGYEVREVPITWRDRPRSTVPPVRTALALAGSLYRARRRARSLDAPIGRQRSFGGAEGTDRPLGDRDAGR